MPTPFTPRVSQLQKRIAKWKVAALLVTNPRDIRYLTGFVGDDSWALIPARGRTVHVLSDFRFEEQIQREAPQVKAVMRTKSLVDELEKLVKRRKMRRIAVQAACMTLEDHAKLVKSLGTSRLKGVDDGLIKQRAVKDEAEVRLIRRAARIQQEAFSNTIRQIEPGQTEEEICALLEYEMRCLGADGPSFPTIVAADANASLPHAIPGKKKVRKGGIILIDWGARYRGYCSDMTRVIALGSMKPKLREIYGIVLEAQMAAIDAIAPGKSLPEIDKVARDIITDAGYGERFGHGLGHGLGLDIHEQPVLSYRVKGKLQPGHVVTVEPGIYLPGVGGVRIEDDVLVTEKGRRVLTNLPKGLDSAILNV